MADHFIPLEGLSGNIWIEIVTPDARGEFRVRLWDKHGRVPDRVNEGEGRFERKTTYSPLLGTAGDLRGRTVTWSMRFVSAANAGNAEYRASIRIKADTGWLHTMEYSGPLDDETHEIAGQFHFQPTAEASEVEPLA